MAKKKFKEAANDNPSGLPKCVILSAIQKGRIKAGGFAMACFIAAGALGDKAGWTGEEYLFHCMTVADPTSAYISEDEKIVGVLHDVVEDSDWELDDLRKAGFAEHIVRGVGSVTKQHGEKYFDAVARASLDPIGRRVKMRDNDHNMKLTRGPFAANVKQKYLYHISWMYLNAVENREIDAGSSIWDFLQMEKYKNLLTPKNYHYVAQQSSIEPPHAVRLEYGRPDMAKTHPKPQRG